jgi:hypothetical protein
MRFQDEKNGAIKRFEKGLDPGRQAEIGGKRTGSNRCRSARRSRRPNDMRGAL